MYLNMNLFLKIVFNGNVRVCNDVKFKSPVLKWISSNEHLNSLPLSARGSITDRESIITVAG